jgi:uncharacterized protein (TIGR04255 family)
MRELDSPFPDSPRVQFELNPIVAAGAFLTFPDHLEIHSDIPVKFQQLVRQSLPNYDAKMVSPSDTHPAGHIQHVFSDAEGTAALSLEKNFLSFFITDYQAWPLFKTRWTRFIGTLTEVYGITHANSFGIRYVDVFSRKRLDLAGSEWKELLNPELLGELSTEASSVRFAIRQRDVQLIFEISETESATVNHRLERDQQTLEEVYVLDSTFSSSKSAPFEEVLSSQDKLNEHSGRFFRWATGEKLQQALRPTSTTSTEVTSVDRVEGT